MCVQATFYQQGNEKRTIVHLLNESNTTGGRALPEGDSSMREEVLPIAGIKVSFADTGISSARLEPEGIDLPLEKSGGKVQVTVPKLELHSMVVAEKG